MISYIWIHGMSYHVLPRLHIENKYMSFITLVYICMSVHECISSCQEIIQNLIGSSQCWIIPREMHFQAAGRNSTLNFSLIMLSEHFLYVEFYKARLPISQYELTQCRYKLIYWILYFLSYCYFTMKFIHNPISYCK
jgi:hypothetical protein